IPESLREKIFDPFFTTKPPGADPNWSHREECFRLSFVREDKEIEEGIVRIGRVLEKFSK
ncbi:hypothetical protein CH375_23350, partial [Leptospira ellisii]